MAAIKAFRYVNYLIIVMTLLIFTIIACSTQASKSAGRDYSISRGDTTWYNIPGDSIGILAREGVSEEQLKKALTAEGYTIARNFQQKIFVIVPGKEIKSDEIFELARNLKIKLKEIITQAGYLAYPEQAEVPVLITDEIVIDFKKEDAKQVTEFLTSNEMELLMQNPFIKTQYLVRLKNNSKGNALKVSRQLLGNDGLKYIHPNFIALKDYRIIPDDPLFNEQWHHRNTGTAGGTPDADIDTDLAWDFTFGNPAVVIAVIDNGFDMTHPDITPNFSINTAEIDGNGLDDDGNSFIDDRIGWDFDGCGGGLPCGDNMPEPASHGAATIGTAAARGRNAIGVAGSCPECGLVPIESGDSAFEDALAFGYAQSRAVKVISCSWGYTIGFTFTMAVETAINNAVAAGITVVFAMPNRDRPYCYRVEPDIAALPNVIGVSRSTNTDRYDESGYGDCMDLLAPSAYCETVSAGRGTLWATTTDRQGTAGFNNADAGGAACMCPTAEVADLNYTKCFNGTSFSAPLTAGVAGLVLSADNSLTPRQVQNLLQDCADKIEPSQGQYSLTTGYSAPAGAPKHGYGRVNAFEAVRIAAPVVSGGKAGVDIFLRDNSLDWGNTEQASNVLFEPVRGFIPHWESVDIKVDAPPFETTAPSTSVAFDAFTDERPMGGMTNRVYVRVHNRGYRPAASVTVKLHWVYAGLTFPPLPSDFWTSFPANASDVSVWHPLGIQPVSGLGYSGCSVAGSSTDASQVVAFDFPAPLHDETLPNHYCLMALIDSPDDRLITGTVSSTFNMDRVTPFTNNATHRNITIMNMAERRSFSEGFFMTNPYKTPITVRISVINSGKIKYRFEKPEVEQSVTLQPNESRLIRLDFDAKELQSDKEVSVQQIRLADGKPGEVMGGIAFRFINKK